MQACVASNKCLPQLHSRNLHLLKLPSQTGALCQSLCREQLLFHLFLLLGSLQHEYLGNISCSVEIKFIKKRGRGCQRPLSFIFLCRNVDFSDYEFTIRKKPTDILYAIQSYHHTKAIVSTGKHFWKEKFIYSKSILSYHSPHHHSVTYLHCMHNLQIQYIMF